MVVKKLLIKAFVVGTLTELVLFYLLLIGAGTHTSTWYASLSLSLHLPALFILGSLASVLSFFDLDFLLQEDAIPIVGGIMWILLWYVIFRFLAKKTHPPISPSKSMAEKIPDGEM
jgi:hypothetical protein